MQVTNILAQAGEQKNPLARLLAASAFLDKSTPPEVWDVFFNALPDAGLEDLCQAKWRLAIVPCVQQNKHLPVYLLCAHIDDASKLTSKSLVSAPVNNLDIAWYIWEASSKGLTAAKIYALLQGLNMPTRLFPLLPEASVPELDIIRTPDQLQKLNKSLYASSNPGAGLRARTIDFIQNS